MDEHKKGDGCLFKVPRVVSERRLEILPVLFHFEGISDCYALLFCLSIDISNLSLFSVSFQFIFFTKKLSI